jgi:DNA-binding beta-propeller fold protein YncE
VTESNRKLSNFLAERERRGRTKRIVALVLLVLLLLLLVWATFNYLENGRIVVPFIGGGEASVTPPEYLYSIAGPEGADALTQPIGVAVTSGDRAYIVDNKNKAIRCYDTDGSYNFSFRAIESDAATALAQPGRVAVSADGEIWVTDRLLQGVFVFSADGKFIREFKAQGDAPTDWAPIAIAFDAEGNVLIADVGRSKLHRVLEYTPDGEEIRRWGKTVQAARMEDSPGGFYYPNGIVVAKNGDIFVSDSNNRRVQVFSSEGEYKYMIPTSGTPRGMAIDADQRLYVVDAFSHTVDIYELNGQRIAGFGGNGVGLGQFQYPSDVSLDSDGRIYVSDRENHQVQVWGWPSVGLIPSFEAPKTPLGWTICLSPLLLFLIPLLRRKRSIVVTSDFIEGMALAEKMDFMNDRRFKWVVPAEGFAEYEGRSLDGVALNDLLHPEPHSESDVAELVQEGGVDRPTAILLTIAQRVSRLATEDEELARSARAMSVQVYDRKAFLDTFGGGTA